MIDLHGKVALILGIANQHSISWGIAQALHEAGAEIALTYRREGRERHVAPLAAQLGARLLARCDARDDAQLADLIAQVRATFGRLDIVVHAAVGASPEDLRGAYLGTTRASFLDALDASVYSLVGLVKAAEELLQPGASVLTLSYHGAPGGPPLQRDGRGEGGARSERALSCTRSRPARGAGEHHQRRPDPHAFGQRHRRLSFWSLPST